MDHMSDTNTPNPEKKRARVDFSSKPLASAKSSPKHRYHPYARSGRPSRAVPDSSNPAELLPSPFTKRPAGILKPSRRHNLNTQGVPATVESDGSSPSSSSPPKPVTRDFFVKGNVLPDFARLERLARNEGPASGSRTGSDVQLLGKDTAGELRKTREQEEINKENRAPGGTGVGLKTGNATNAAAIAEPMGCDVSPSSSSSSTSSDETGTESAMVSCILTICSSLETPSPSSPRDPGAETGDDDASVFLPRPSPHSTAAGIRALLPPTHSSARSTSRSAHPSSPLPKLQITLQDVEVAYSNFVTGGPVTQGSTPASPNGLQAVLKHRLDEILQCLYRDLGNLYRHVSTSSPARKQSGMAASALMTTPPQDDEQSGTRKGLSTAEIRRKVVEMSVGKAAIRFLGRILFESAVLDIGLQESDVKSLVKIVLDVSQARYTTGSSQGRDILNHVMWFICSMRLPCELHLECLPSFTNSLVTTLFVANKLGEKGKGIMARCLEAAKCLIEKSPLPVITEHVKFYPNALLGLTSPSIKLRSQAVKVLSAVAKALYTPELWEQADGKGEITRSRMIDEISQATMGFLTSQRVTASGKPDGFTELARLDLYLKSSMAHSGDSKSKPTYDLAQVCWGQTVLALLPMILAKRFRQLESALSSKAWFQVFKQCCEIMDQAETVSLSFSTFRHFFHASLMASRTNQKSELWCLIKTKPWESLSRILHRDQPDVWSLGSPKPLQSGILQTIVSYLYGFTTFIQQDPHLFTVGPRDNISYDEKAEAETRHRGYNEVWSKVVEVDVKSCLSCESDEARIVSWRLLGAILSKDEHPRSTHIQLDKLVCTPLLDGRLLEPNDVNSLRAIAKEVERNCISPEDVPGWGGGWIIGKHRKILAMVELALKAIGSLKSVASVEWAVGGENEMALIPIAVERLWERLVDLASTSSDVEGRRLAASTAEMLASLLHSEKLQPPAGESSWNGAEWRMRIVHRLFSILMDKIQAETVPRAISLLAEGDRLKNHSMIGAMLQSAIRFPRLFSEDTSLTTFEAWTAFIHSLSLRCQDGDEGRRTLETFLVCLSRDHLKNAHPVVVKNVGQALCRIWAQFVSDSAGDVLAAESVDAAILLLAKSISNDAPDENGLLLWSQLLRGIVQQLGSRSDTAVLDVVAASLPCRPQPEHGTILSHLLGHLNCAGQATAELLPRVNAYLCEALSGEESDPAAIGMLRKCSEHLRRASQSLSKTLLTELKPAFEICLRNNQPSLGIARVQLVSQLYKIILLELRNIVRPCEESFKMFGALLGAPLQHSCEAEDLLALGDFWRATFAQTKEPLISWPEDLKGPLLAIRNMDGGMDLPGWPESFDTLSSLLSQDCQGSQAYDADISDSTQQQLPPAKSLHVEDSAEGSTKGHAKEPRSTANFLQDLTNLGLSAGLHEASSQQSYNDGEIQKELEGVWDAQPEVGSVEVPDSQEAEMAQASGDRQTVTGEPEADGVSHAKRRAKRASRNSVWVAPKPKRRRGAKRQPLESTQSLPDVFADDDDECVIVCSSRAARRQRGQRSQSAVIESAPSESLQIPKASESLHVPASDPLPIVDASLSLRVPTPSKKFRRSPSSSGSTFVGVVLENAGRYERYIRKRQARENSISSSDSSPMFSLKIGAVSAGFQPGKSRITATGDKKEKDVPLAEPGSDDSYISGLSLQLSPYNPSTRGRSESLEVGKHSKASGKRKLGPANLDSDDNIPSSPILHAIKRRSSTPGSQATSPQDLPSHKASNVSSTTPLPKESAQSPSLYVPRKQFDDSSPDSNIRGSKKRRTKRGSTGTTSNSKGSPSTSSENGTDPLVGALKNVLADETTSVDPDETDKLDQLLKNLDPKLLSRLIKRLPAVTAKAEVVLKSKTSSRDSA